MPKTASTTDYIAELPVLTALDCFCPSSAPNTKCTWKTHQSVRYSNAPFQASCLLVVNFQQITHIHFLV